jgi:hypothetical protein
MMNIAAIAAKRAQARAERAAEGKGAPDPANKKKDESKAAPTQAVQLRKTPAKEATETKKDAGHNAAPFGKKKA